MSKKKTKEQILKEKTSSAQHRDYSDKVGPVHIQMTADECRKACKDAGVEYKKGYEARVLSYTCSDESVDRMGDIIKQDGWKLENFKKNPVVMGFHDYSTFPVGNALSVGVVDGKLKMHILFADKEVNEDADKAFRMAKSGFMRAGSVGFNPSKYHMATENEIKELGMGQHGIMFEEQELMEYSVCGVPANANALQESISKGMFRKSDFEGWVKDDVLKEIKDVQPEPQEETKPLPDPEPEPKPEEKAIHTNTINEYDIEQMVNKKVSEAMAEAKAGAVLSRKNKEAVNNAIDSMEKAVNALIELLKNAESSKEEPNDVSNTSEDTSDEKSIINIDFDSIGDLEDGEALYTDDTLFNIEL